MYWERSLQARQESGECATVQSHFKGLKDGQAVHASQYLVIRPSDMVSDCP